MSDEDGYPTEDELKRVEEWADHANPHAWFSYIKSVGNYWPDESWGWHEKDHATGEWPGDKPYHAYFISTGGWSGNESILEAMQNNFEMWHSTWYSHRVGGHYEFRVRNTQEARQ